MMLTIGKHHSGRRPDFQEECDICGVTWLRSRMKKDAEGFWVCPDDQGKTAKELDLGRAADASAMRPMRGKEP